MAAPSVPDGLDELRQLLVAPEREELRALRARLDDPAVRAHDLMTGLPEALGHLSGDRRLTEAIQPSVETAITTSVRRNPKPLADALFPVIGPAIRKAIYTTNAIESVNSVIRKFTRNRNIYPSEESALKNVYMAIREASSKWTMPIHHWKQALNHFAILFEDRMPKTISN